MEFKMQCASEKYLFQLHRLIMEATFSVKPLTTLAKSYIYQSIFITTIQEIVICTAAILPSIKLTLVTHHE